MFYNRVYPDLKIPKVNCYFIHTLPTRGELKMHSVNSPLKDSQLASKSQTGMLRVQEQVFAECFLWFSSWSKTIVRFLYKGRSEVRFLSNPVASEAGHQ